MAAGARSDATRADTRRPVRFGLVAALAGCMLGGVTVAAATTGILPSPFGGSPPRPSVSVSGAVTPAHPPASPSSSASAGGSTGPGPSTSPSGPIGAPPRGVLPDSGTAENGDGEPGDAEMSENWWVAMMNACRDHRGGNQLDGRTEQELEDAAHGRGRVETFCDGLLGAEGTDPDHTRDTSANDDEGTGTVGGGRSDGPGDDGGPSDTPSPAPDPTPTTEIGTPVPSETPEPAATVTFSEPPTQ